MHLKYIKPMQELGFTHLRKDLVGREYAHILMLSSQDRFFR